jgi:hypothetical protein
MLSKVIVASAVIASASAYVPPMVSYSVCSRILQGFWGSKLQKLVELNLTYPEATFWMGVAAWLLLELCWRCMQLHTRG